MLGCPFGWRTNPAGILPCLKDAPSPHLWGNFRESLCTHTHVLQPRPPELGPLSGAQAHEGLSVAASVSWTGGGDTTAAQAAQEEGA